MFASMNPWAGRKAKTTSSETQLGEAGSGLPARAPRTAPVEPPAAPLDPSHSPHVALHPFPRSPNPFGVTHPIGTHGRCRINRSQELFTLLARLSSPASTGHSAARLCTASRFRSTRPPALSGLRTPVPSRDHSTQLTGHHHEQREPQHQQEQRLPLPHCLHAECSAEPSRAEPCSSTPPRCSGRGVTQPSPARPGPAPRAPLPAPGAVPARPLGAPQRLPRGSRLRAERIEAKWAS